MEEMDFTKKTYFILLFIAAIFVGYLCKTLSSVILPILISIILALVLMPIVTKANKKLHIPWAIASILIVILFIIGLLGFSSILVRSLSTIFSEYPKYENKFLYIYKLIANQFNLEFDESQSFITNIWKSLQVREMVQKSALFLSSGAVSLGKNLFMISLMLVFLLIELKNTRKKINSAFVGKAKGKILRISTKIAEETVHYLSIKFFISLATGIIIFLGALMIGLDFPVVWGFLAFIMNFIPTFGSIFSTIITTLFALVQFYPNHFKIIFIFVLMLTVNMVLGNIVEPKIEGKHLGLSTFAILASLSLWGYIWGFIGMLLAVPLTVIIKIISENISYLNIFAVLLGTDSSNTGIEKEQNLKNQHNNSDNISEEN